MIVFPPHLANHDVPHLGVLFKRIREARGLSQTDIACALDVTCSTISRFESAGRSRRHAILERYIRALQSPKLNGSPMHAPLNATEGDLLLRLSHTARDPEAQMRAVHLGAYDFDILTAPRCPVALKLLLQRLRQSRWPAFICDGIWYIHAVNGAMLNLFNVEPHAAILRHWESWHMIATLLHGPSPTRAAHINPDVYIPPTISAFFHGVLPYLFTPQLRVLLRALHELSARDCIPFSRWWYAATSFSLPFGTVPTARILQAGTRAVHTTSVTLEEHVIPLVTGVELPFYLGVWRPLGADTESAYQYLPGYARSQDIFFAADFDLTHSFHVNFHPEVVHDISPALRP